MSGRVLLTGTAAQNAILAPMARTISDVLGARLKNDVTVEVRARDRMPLVPASNPPIHAEGYTPSGIRILFSADLFARPKLAPKVLAHEMIHAYAAQVGSKAFREACLALLPAGSKWDAPGYTNDGREVVACYGSSAIFGVPYPPPYINFYAYKMPAADLPKLATALLADYSGTPPVVEPPPLPVPVDTAELQAEIDTLRYVLAQTALDLDPLTSTMASLAAKLSSIADRVRGLW